MTYIATKIYNISGINDEFDGLFKKFGSKFKVNPKHIKALSLNESYLGQFTNSDTVNGQTTKGLLHIQIPTARDYVPRISENELLKPDNQIAIASEHFAWLLRRYNNDLELAVRGYNGGAGRVDQYQAGLAPFIWIQNTNEYWARFQRNLSKLGA
jgi:soluble lytic murein transglycosylase-like protein